jgi:FMNH2-dependent dimethyl sulfone monooxygenase
MQFGVWLPVYGEWLRAEGFTREPDFETCLRLAQTADHLGYTTLYASENFLNCVHGGRHDVADAWTTLSALAMRTDKIRLVGAVKPGFRPPLVAAQMIATTDRISRGRVGVNIVCGWWREEFERCEIPWRQHDEKYTYAARYLRALQDFWSGESDPNGPWRRLARDTRPPIWISGHSDDALLFAAKHADTLFINGMSLEELHQLRDRFLRRCQPHQRPKIAMNAFIIQADSDAEAERRRADFLSRARSDLIAFYRAASEDAGAATWRHLSDAELIDSNGGFATALVGSAQTIYEKLAAYEKAGIDLVMCQFASVVADSELFGVSVLPRFAHPVLQTETIGDQHQ